VSWGEVESVHTIVAFKHTVCAIIIDLQPGPGAPLYDMILISETYKKIPVKLPATFVMSRDSTTKERAVCVESHYGI